MTQQPFHHGNLRAVLLDEATTVLRESGVEGLSLRDLARRAGVSHGAPRSHFVDRQALLDALAESGFVRLTASVRDVSAGGGDLPRRFREVARAYVDFAIVDAALMELMFPVGTARRAGHVDEAAGALFATLDGALGPAADGAEQVEYRDVLKMLFASTMQGIAALVVSGRVARDQVDGLVDAAVDMMLGSELRRRAIAVD